MDSVQLAMRQYYSLNINSLKVSCWTNKKHICLFIFSSEIFFPSLLFLNAASRDWFQFVNSTCRAMNLVQLPYCLTFDLRSRSWRTVLMCVSSPAVTLVSHESNRVWPLIPHPCLIFLESGLREVGVKASSGLREVRVRASSGLSAYIWTS